MFKSLLSLLLIGGSSLFAQLNTTLRSNLDYAESVNDVWGYVAPDGTEYAIVGLQTGVSFVSLADPDNPVEVDRILGDFSNWRDMKTYGEYAYSVADQSNSNEGITAFDLSQLPDSVTFKRNAYEVAGTSTLFSRAHNVYVDTLDGVLLTAGGDRRIGDGGILAFDLTETPMSPRLFGQGAAIYAHDVFVLNDTMYASEIYRGRLTLYDVTDYTNVTLLGSVRTPYSFAHNAWASDDGRYVYTTDEKPNASVAAYDVSNKMDIQKLDEYRPVSSLNTGTIPHNVHVIGDFLSISYYTDGLRVVDATDPTNLVEVANYDTWLGDDGGFNGAWGAYPFLPSGLTLISDRQSGLYVVDVDYKRAARLRGILTDRFTGAPVNNVRVVIDSTQENIRTSNPLGRYATGLGTAGTYVVTFTSSNYESLTVAVNLENGETFTLDTTLVPLVRSYDAGFTVTTADGGEPLANAQIAIEGTENTFLITTDESGMAEVAGILENEPFTVYVSEWGYQTQAIQAASSADLQNVTVDLVAGFMDDFATDEGWTVTSNPVTGEWERAIPSGTATDTSQIAPGADAADDIGDRAWVTDNRNEGRLSAYDVDEGVATFASPTFRPLVANADTMTVHYQYWFVNLDGRTAADDTLTISISNGVDTVVARAYGNRGGKWLKDSFTVNDFVTITDQMQLIVSTSDFNTSSHLVEAGFDNFFVTETASRPVATDNNFTEGATVEVYPNPARGAFTMDYDLGMHQNASLRITDASGRVVSSRTIAGGTVTFGDELPRGFYWLELLSGTQRLWVGKAMKE
ncbi:choice-of-anchor B family protein [Neolewinella antarctica]|uniref:Choice-of-anchor B domain-containing protein n=1 Tax=Neolewinella antarctica TaxID=442734 RepID=A0ABX0X604_9BACT|nr:choice-of-anchor B family protein [Neolewinella antarctica]NJC24562.1 choice-of-anchor B domain-containing protein [Neolewinella antarctica]